MSAISQMNEPAGTPSHGWQLAVYWLFIGCKCGWPVPGLRLRLSSPALIVPTSFACYVHSPTILIEFRRKLV